MKKLAIAILLVVTFNQKLYTQYYSREKDNTE